MEKLVKYKWAFLVIVLLCAASIMFVVGIQKERIQEPKISSQIDDFSQSDMKLRTEAFLLERAKVLCNDKTYLVVETDFFAPENIAEKEREEDLRNQILSYATQINGDTRGYNTPRVSIEIVKKDEDTKGQIVFTAKEEVFVKTAHGDTDTGFGNDHVFTYGKVDGKWKLVKDKITSKNSMISPEE